MENNSNFDALLARCPQQPVSYFLRVQSYLARMGVGSDVLYKTAPNGDMLIYTSRAHAFNISALLSSYEEASLLHFYHEPWEDRFVVASVSLPGNWTKGELYLLLKETFHPSLAIEVQSSPYTKGVFFLHTPFHDADALAKALAGGKWRDVKVLLIYYAQHAPAALPIHPAFGVVGQYAPTETVIPHTTSDTETSWFSAFTPPSDNDATLRFELQALGFADIPFHQFDSCRWCSTRDATMRARPCGHLALCDGCFRKYICTPHATTCPICLRRNIRFESVMLQLPKLVPIASAASEEDALLKVALREELTSLGIRTDYRLGACFRCGIQDVEYRADPCGHRVLCGVCLLKYLDSACANVCPLCLQHGVLFNPVSPGKGVLTPHAVAQEADDFEHQIQETLRADLKDLGIAFVVRGTFVQHKCARCNIADPQTRAVPCGHANFCQACTQFYVTTPLYNRCPQCLRPGVTFEEGAFASTNTVPSPNKLVYNDEKYTRDHLRKLQIRADLSPNQHYGVCVWCCTRLSTMLARPCSHLVFCDTCCTKYQATAIKHTCPQCCLLNVTFEAGKWEPSIKPAPSTIKNFTYNDPTRERLKRELLDLNIKDRKPGYTGLECAWCYLRNTESMAQPCGHMAFCSLCLADYLKTPLRDMCPLYECLQRGVTFEKCEAPVVGWSGPTAEDFDDEKMQYYWDASDDDEKGAGGGVQYPSDEEMGDDSDNEKK